VTTVTSTKPAVMSAALLPVRYRNREGDYMSDSTPRRTMALAGDYYFVVTVARTGPGLGTPGRFQLSLEISVAVDGRPSGAPNYQQAEPTQTPTESPTSTDSVNPPPDSSSEGGQAVPTPGVMPAGDGSSGWILPAAAGGGGLVVLILAVLVGLVLRSSRIRRDATPTPLQGPPLHGPPPYGPPPGPPPPGGPPQP
jgi:Ca-activated chloride channel homolog